MSETIKQPDTIVLQFGDTPMTSSQLNGIAGDGVWEFMHIPSHAREPIGLAIRAVLNQLSDPYGVVRKPTQADMDWADALIEAHPEWSEL